MSTYDSNNLLPADYDRWKTDPEFSIESFTNPKFSDHYFCEYHFLDEITSYDYLKDLNLISDN